MAQNQDLYQRLLIFVAEEVMLGRMETLDPLSWRCLKMAAAGDPQARIDCELLFGTSISQRRLLDRG